MKKLTITTLLVAITLLNSGILLLPNQLSAQGIEVAPELTESDVSDAAKERLANAEATTARTQAELDASDARKEQLAQQAAAANAAPAKSDPAIQEVGACKPWINFLTTRCWGTIMIGGAGSIVNLGGKFLNFSIDISILKMSGIVKDLGSINAAWKVFRDLANVFFIFILIYIAISTILGASSGQTKKMLINVILVALFINFSMFATKVVIDASNIVTVQFYNSISQGIDVSENGLSQVFMNGSHFNTMFNNVPERNYGEINFLLIGFLSIIFALVLAISLAAIGVLFLIRLVVFIMLIILSPLAFLGLTLPQLSEGWNKWKKALTDQAIFAPFMMAMLWVVAAIINNKSFMSALHVTNPTVSWANALGGTPGDSIYVVVNFAILIIMLIAGMAISKQWAGKSGDAILGMADKYARKVAYSPGVPFRATGRFGVGLASKYGGKLYDAAEARLKDTGFAKSKFGKYAGYAATATGLSALNRSARETLAAGEEVKFGLEKSYKGRGEEDEKRATTLAQVRNEQIADSEEKKQLAILKAPIGPQNTQAQIDEAARMLSQIYAQKSSKEVEEQLNKGKLSGEQLAKAVSLKHIEALKKSDTANKKALEELLAQRFKTIDETLAKGATATAAEINTMQKTVGSMSDKEIELLGYVRLSNDNVAKALNQDHLDSLKKSAEYTPGQVDQIKTNRQRAISDTITSAIPNGLQSIRDAIKEMKLRDKDIAKLDRSILTHNDFNQVYAVSMLQEIAKEPTLTPADKALLRQNLENDANVSQQIKRWLLSPAGSVI